MLCNEGFVETPIEIELKRLQAVLYYEKFLKLKKRSRGKTLDCF